MSRDDHAVQLIESWRPKRRLNIITSLTTLPQRWFSTHKHQYTTVITTKWTESLWAFPERYTADESGIVRSSDGGQRGDKRAHNSTIKGSFFTIIIRLCHCTIAITRGSQNLCSPFLRAVKFIYLFILYSSGNRTPGGRFYSDLLDTLADSVYIHQAVLKRRSKR